MYLLFHEDVYIFNGQFIVKFTITRCFPRSLDTWTAMGNQSGEELRVTRYLPF